MTDFAPFSNRQSSVVEVINDRDLINNKFAPFNGKELDFHELWKVLVRRKRLAIVVALIVVALSAVNAVYQRTFNPVFRGSFALLITDPISNDSGKRVPNAADGTLFEQLALNTTNNNIPTLIEFLRSPLMLAPIAERFNIHEN